MEEFTKKNFSDSNLIKQDKGVSVSKVIELAKSNEFYKKLAELLNVSQIENDFIEIKGASLLIDRLSTEDKRFKKFNHKSDYHDLEFFYADDNHFYISFLNIKDEHTNQMIAGDEFTCRTEYNSRIDFYTKTFSIQGFAGDLVKKGHSEFAKHTLYSVKDLIKRGDHKHIYRILKDNQGLFYLRAIVSEIYNDYSNNITAFLGLIGLHYETKKSGNKFIIQRFEYNESFVRILFAKEESRMIEGIGKMRYVIEVSNDEIKREALRFIGAATILYDDEKGNTGELYIKPSNLKSKILTISHSVKPETAIKQLGDLENYVGKEDQMYNDIVGISKVQNPNTVRHLIYNRIRQTSKPEIMSNKKLMLAELNTAVDNMYQLFVALNKVDKIAIDIEAKEYLRFLFFDALVYRKLPKEGKDDSDVSNE